MLERKLREEEELTKDPTHIEDDPLSQDSENYNDDYKLMI